jgi:hypothetical protein
MNNNDIAYKTLTDLKAEILANNPPPYVFPSKDGMTLTIIENALDQLYKVEKYDHYISK